MKNTPELLIATDEINCQIYTDVLKSESIKFEIKESDIKAAYGGSSFFGKSIYVLKSDLEKARKILGLTEEK